MLDAISIGRALRLVKRRCNYKEYYVDCFYLAALFNVDPKQGGKVVDTKDFSFKPKEF